MNQRVTRGTRTSAVWHAAEVRTAEASLNLNLNAQQARWTVPANSFGRREQAISLCGLQCTILKFELTADNNPDDEDLQHSRSAHSDLGIQATWKKGEKDLAIHVMSTHHARKKQHLILLHFCRLQPLKNPLM
jgi:hypothetical protein